MWRFAHSHPHIVEDHVKIECSAAASQSHHSQPVPAMHATPKSILKQTASDTAPVMPCHSIKSPSSEEEEEEQQEEEREGPPSSRINNRRRRNEKNNGIRFHDQAEILLIPHVDEYTDNERQLIWFEQTEYAQIKENNKILLDMITRNLHSLDHYEDHEDYCFRGLESKVSAATSTSSSFFSSLGEKRKRSSRSKRRQNRKDSSKAVLIEQERQYKEQRSVTDWERIREAYIDITARCHDEAHTQGLRDAEKASQLHS
mmetsp:Transcript_26035/g.61802  ORF Transcript_26035/g.61802 Transcript_26035/m.61802 type:complete len:258 (-) Transcript_26035:357-1130(-)